MGDRVKPKTRSNEQAQNLGSALQAPLIRTDRLVLRLASQQDREVIAAFYRANKDHLERYSGQVSERNLEDEFWIERINEMHSHFVHDRACNFFLFGERERLLGYVNFFNFIRGSFQCCTLGYGLAQDVQGKGLMTEALAAAIPFTLRTLSFHRIEANYHPANGRSAAVLRKLGFVEEGCAQQYLRIRGVWEPHIRTSLTNLEWQPRMGI